MPLNDSESSYRSSTLTSALDDSVADSPTPRTLESSSNLPYGLPVQLSKEGASRLPHMSSIAERTTDNKQLDAIEAMMTRMQANLQSSLQASLESSLAQRQKDFETRIEAFLIGNAKGISLSSDPANKPSTWSLPSDPSDIDPQAPDGSQAGGATADLTDHEKFSQSTFTRLRQSPYAREPSHPQSYSRDYSHPISSSNKPSPKLKASDLPRFQGEKTDDVEVWIGQVSAIFEANRCSSSEIVALLSVILKDTALKWFTRLGPKGRAKFTSWSHWQDALRQSFVKANYLAEKKRLWKKRYLQIDEDMADYFDAKVDLQAYVFDEHTPESELILDLLDGLPAHMLPTLKASIFPNTSLMEFRRILLDYEKGLRWDGIEEREINVCQDYDTSSDQDDRDGGHYDSRHDNGGNDTGHDEDNSTDHESD
jgi:hypothetical protein